jgi:hypothetical protein
MEVSGRSASCPEPVGRFGETNDFSTLPGIEEYENGGNCRLI